MPLATAREAMHSSHSSARHRSAYAAHQLPLAKRGYRLHDLASELALGPEGLAAYSELLRPIEMLAV
jgi:hypothetical protein